MPARKPLTWKDTDTSGLTRALYGTIAARRDMRDSFNDMGDTFDEWAERRAQDKANKSNADLFATLTGQGTPGQPGAQGGQGTSGQPGAQGAPETPGALAQQLQASVASGAMTVKEANTLWTQGQEAARQQQLMNTLNDPNAEVPKGMILTAGEKQIREALGKRRAVKTLGAMGDHERGATFQERQQNLHAFHNSPEYVNALPEVRDWLDTLYTQKYGIDTKKLNTPETAGVSQLEYGDKFYDSNQKRVDDHRQTVKFQQGQEDRASKAPDKAAKKFGNYLETVPNVNIQEIRTQFENGDFGELTRQDFETGVMWRNSNDYITDSANIVAPQVEKIVPVIREFESHLRHNDFIGATKLRDGIDLEGQIANISNKIENAIYNHPEYQAVPIAQKDKLVKQMKDAAGITAIEKRYERLSKRYLQLHKADTSKKKKAYERGLEYHDKYQKKFTEQNDAFKGWDDKAAEVVQTITKTNPVFRDNEGLLFKLMAQDGASYTFWDGLKYGGQKGEKAENKLFEDAKLFVKKHPEYYPDIYDKFFPRKR